MRNLFAAVLLLLALAVPAAADWRADASTLTFYVQGTTANMTELYNAMLWKYRAAPLDGLLASAAYPQIALTSLGGGNHEISVTMTLAVGNNWVLNLVLLPCPSANTTALRRACADPLIKADLLILWRQYKLYLRDTNATCMAIVAEPPAL